MVPASYLRPLFDLCFAPLHDGVAAGGNIVTTIGPPNCSRPQGEKNGSAGLILLGGVDPKSHDWRSGEIAERIRTIVLRGGEVRWTVSSSPRTPPDIVGMMNELANELANVDFFRFEDTEPGWIEGQYARSRIVWVTADSMSMVYEALSAGCRVGLLPVAWKRAENKFKRSADYLARHGLVVPYSSWLAGGEGQWQEHEPLNEARRCAAEIVRRWPPKD
jgi:mitochondrial fission protein ELM1